MVSFQQYEELCSIFERMDGVMQYSKRNPTQAEGRVWAWQKQVIEANHVSLEPLNLPTDSWRFTGEVPAPHQRIQHRRWFIREKTQQQTEVLSDETVPTQVTALPNGVSLWHATENAKRLTVIAIHDATLLLEEQFKKQTIPAANEWRTDGQYSLFKTPGDTRLNLGDSLDLLRPHAPYLARLIDDYASCLSWMFNVEPYIFSTMCSIQITWFPPGGGTPMRLMESSTYRSENGPVVHVGLGRSKIAHDLAPTVQDPSDPNRSPVRLTVSEGTMVCLDGPARICYSHGYPARHQGKERSNWLALVFFMDCTDKSVAVGYEGNTRLVVMQTPIDKDRVIRVRNPPELPVAGIKRNLMTTIIQNMRVRLRMAESFKLKRRAECP
jgi:hypothetical protein